jgi:Mannosyl-glycoprotein endo-beta-N-acetylglucosaminidase.
MTRLCFSFLLFISAISISAKNHTESTPITGVPTATVADAKEWAKKKGATDAFIALADLYWKKATELGINPVVAYCQAAKETGYGRFGGIIDATFNNPCGIKSFRRDGDHKDDHMRFETWEDGVEAHLDHLALYIGLEGYPKDETKDPRHHGYLKGIAKTVKEMGRRWAMSPGYSTELARMIKTLENMSVKRK